jgi:hypothetical protein
MRESKSRKPIVTSLVRKRRIISAMGRNFSKYHSLSSSSLRCMLMSIVSP